MIIYEATQVDILDEITFILYEFWRRKRVTSNIKAVLDNHDLYMNTYSYDDDYKIYDKTTKQLVGITYKNDNWEYILELTDYGMDLLNADSEAYIL